MTKGKKKKNKKRDMAYSELRWFKDSARPVVFQDKKHKKPKHKKHWRDEIDS